MLTLRDPIERVRDACTRNNVHWLRAFGCSVEVNPQWLRVWHDELSEFRALVVLGDAPPADPQHVENWVHTATDEALAVYLDDVANFSWHAALNAHGFHATTRTCVRAMGVCGAASPDRSLRLIAVDASGFNDWSDLYSRIFERPAALAASDRRRWAEAFANSSLRHYLYQSGTNVVGLCQLCLSDGVAGLYSVGFLPSARSPDVLRTATQLVREEVVHHGLGLVYFERSRVGGDRRQPTARGSNVRRVLRSFQIWKLNRPV